MESRLEASADIVVGFSTENVCEGALMELEDIRFVTGPSIHPAHIQVFTDKTDIHQTPPFSQI